MHASDDLTPDNLRPMEVGRSGSGGASLSKAVALRFPTGYRGHRSRGTSAWSPWRALGCVPSSLPGGDDDLYVSDDEWPDDDDDDADSTTAGVRWLTVTHEHWETGSAVHDGSGCATRHRRARINCRY